VRLNGEGGQASYKGSEEAFSKTQFAVVALVCAAFGVGAFVALMITRSITRPIFQAVKVAETVAAGDLRSAVVVEGRDEMAQLL
ncbi:HAMP domain-containing protein, partial [Staphylococcus aureus]